MQNYVMKSKNVVPQIHRQRPAWEDPVEWVRDTLPWPSAQQDQAKLFHLPPPTVDSSSSGQLCEERVAKETQIPSSLESDPLVRCIPDLLSVVSWKMYALSFFHTFVVK